MTSSQERFRNHKVWIAGLALGFIISFTLGESRLHAQSVPTKSPAKSPASGIGPGVKVDNPPASNSGAASAPAGLKRGWTGTCRVQIRDHYRKYVWDEHTKCGEEWGFHDQLVTIRNSGHQPVFVNEWYAGDWHGQTTILPGQTVVMPVFETPFSTALFVGACWQGSGGPGTCKSGPHNRTTNVEIVRWQEIPRGSGANSYLLIRDANAIGLSAMRGSSYTAVNLGDHAVQLHWPELGRDRWVDLPLKGRIEKIPPGDMNGRKDFGSGAVALVDFVPVPRERGEEIYRLVTPSERTGVPPFAHMTFLNGSWCSVHIENLGPARVILQSWIIPLLKPGGNDLSLEKGATGTLKMNRGTLLITGHVGTGSTGEFTLVKATAWKQCN